MPSGPPVAGELVSAHFAIWHVDDPTKARSAHYFWTLDDVALLARRFQSARAPLAIYAGKPKGLSVAEARERVTEGTGRDALELESLRMALAYLEGVDPERTRLLTSSKYAPSKHGEDAKAAWAGLPAEVAELWRDWEAAKAADDPDAPVLLAQLNEELLPFGRRTGLPLDYWTWWTRPEVELAPGVWLRDERPARPGDAAA